MRVPLSLVSAAVSLSLSFACVLTAPIACSLHARREAAAGERMQPGCFIVVFSPPVPPVPILSYNLGNLGNLGDYRDSLYACMSD